MASDATGAGADIPPAPQLVGVAAAVDRRARARRIALRSLGVSAAVALKFRGTVKSVTRDWSQIVRLLVH